MKHILLLLMFAVSSLYAEEYECAFDTNAKQGFYDDYIASYKEVSEDGDGLIITKSDEVIKITISGCEHFGISITSSTSSNYTEAQFVTKVIALVEEFGSTLMDMELLKQALSTDKKWQKDDQGYFVEIENVTSFYMSNEQQGKVVINFYLM